MSYSLASLTGVFLNWQMIRRLLSEVRMVPNDLNTTGTLRTREVRYDL